MELQLEPPDDRTDRTRARLPRPIRQAKTDGQARINLGQANSDSDRSFSLLARLARTACTGDRSDDLASLFDPMMDFSFGNSLRQGSLGFLKTWATLERNLSDQNVLRPLLIVLRPLLSTRTNLTALDTTSLDEPGQ